MKENLNYIILFLLVIMFIYKIYVAINLGRKIIIKGLKTRTQHIIIFLSIIIFFSLSYLSDNKLKGFFLSSLVSIFFLLDNTVEGLSDNSFITRMTGRDILREYKFSSMRSFYQMEDEKSNYFIVESLADGKYIKLRFPLEKKMKIIDFFHERGIKLKIK